MTRAFVCGCRGPALSREEEGFLRGTQPFGVILFKRNVETPGQLRALVEDIRLCVGPQCEILVDQEGGRVQRLGPPHWRAYPAAARFQAADLPIEEKERLVWIAARLIAFDLNDIAITIDCAPVLDLPVAGSHDVIGDRAYGRDPDIVTRLGRAAAQGLLDGGILPVMKHLPGHGRALVDSHLALPVVSVPLSVLEDSDFIPFARNAHLPAAMTAHVIYDAIDPKRPATLSPKVIREIIREKIDFKGLLFSDDLSMHALSGSLHERAVSAFAAGIDIALHCNGHLDEARAVAEASPELEGGRLARVEAALACRKRAALAADAEFDPVEAWAELAAALAIEA